MKNRRVVITGGAGFLGSHVARLLVESGNDVVVLDDFSNGKDLHLNPIANEHNLQVIREDITNATVVDNALRGADVVIHLAVLGLRQSIKQPRRVNEVIVEGTLNCLDAARAHGVSLFLNCSSSEVYGSARYVPMDENHPLLPETPYAAAKVPQDMYVSSYGRTYGIPWTTVRPFNMYGPNSHWQGFRGELIPKMIVRAMNQKPLVIFGDGLQTRDFLFVEEAARAVVAIADNPSCRDQSINLCTGVETSIRRVAEIVCAKYDLDPKSYIEHQTGRPADVHRHQGDNNKFKSIVGFTPAVSLEEGIRRTIEWFDSLGVKPETLLGQEVLRNWE